MAHITLNTDAPGIVGLFNFSPETAKPMRALAQTLLHIPSSLTQGEREMIAAFVSSRNGCRFCTDSHAAFAEEHLQQDAHLMEQVVRDFRKAAIGDKLKALLEIAARVQVSGKEVTSAEIETARASGATDKEIHDTVLITAAFCMYNRYVDGLATFAPPDKNAYRMMAKEICRTGYEG